MAGQLVGELLKGIFTGTQTWPSSRDLPKERIALDTGLLIDIIDRKTRTTEEVLKGKIGVVSPAAAKEFVYKGLGLSLDLTNPRQAARAAALDAWAAANSIARGALPTVAELQSLQSRARERGRELSEYDLAIAASAVKDRVGIITIDERFATSLNNINIPNQLLERRE